MAATTMLSNTGITKAAPSWVQTGAAVLCKVTGKTGSLDSGLKASIGSLVEYYPNESMRAHERGALAPLLFDASIDKCPSVIQRGYENDSRSASSLKPDVPGKLYKFLRRQVNTEIEEQKEQ